MAKKQKKDYRFKEFEGNPSGKHIRVTILMMDSKAFVTLSKYAKLLYFYMKAEYNGPDAVKIRNTNKGKIELKSEEFLYTYSDAKDQLGMDSRSFTKARDELIEHGLIELIQQSFHKVDPNIYKFSDKWKKFGTESINISKRTKRKPNLNQIEAVKEALKRNNYNRKNNQNE